jgi:hypothetical protein
VALGDAAVRAVLLHHGVGAALCSILVSPNSTIPIIGASGAIYGILAAYGILFPDRTLLLYFVIPIKAKYFVLILGALAFWATLTSTGGGVANVAHLGGLLFGWLYMRRFGRGAGRAGPSSGEIPSSMARARPAEPAPEEVQGSTTGTRAARTTGETSREVGDGGARPARRDRSEARRLRRS